MGVIKNSPPYPMLVNQRATNPSSYIVPRDSQGQLSSNELWSRADPCELVGDLISSYSSMSRDPVQPHRMPGRDIIQRLLVLLDKWRRFDGLESFQNRLTVTADTHVLLWPTLKLNFINTHQTPTAVSWFPPRPLGWVS